MPLETVPFDTAKYLTDPQDQAELLAEAFSTGDADTIRKAVSIVARARGMSRVAADAGVTREGVYKALSPDGDPKLSTVLSILSALGVRLSATLDAAGPHPAE
ncbi:MAG: addiction module antidote protein [Janthinobacterium lividum]